MASNTMLNFLDSAVSVRHSLSRKLLLRILLISSVFTLLSTGGQLYLEYRTEEDRLLEKKNHVEDKYIGPLTNELWEVDTDQINVMLKSIYAIPDVTYVELIDDTLSRKSAVLGEKVAGRSVFHSYPLIFKNKQSLNVSLGSVRIQISYRQIFERLRETLLLIFAMQLIKTFAMTLFIFIIMQRLIIRHINHIALYLDSLRIGSLDAPLVLSRESAGEARGDELDKVVGSVNRMRSQLAVEMLDHERSRRLLEESEQRLSTTLNSLSEGVISYNMEGSVVGINSAAGKLTGWDCDAAIGEPIERVFNTSALQPRHQLLQNLDNTTHMVELTDRQGECYLIATSKAPVLTEQASFLGTVLVFRDVTTEVHLRQSAHHNDKLRALGQLSGGIAHDINNMLAVITGASELIGMDPEAPDTSRELALRITESSQRGGKLIERLLAFSRKGNAGHERFDLHQVIDEAVEMLSQTENKNISIVVDQQARNSDLIGQRSSIESSLMNLGLNAFQAMRSGGELSVRTGDVLLSKSVASSRYLDLDPGPYIEVTLADTGIGINPENIPFIFEPFFTTKDKTEGVGLGLWSVYGTVREHHGDIKVTSERGQGTVFQILLPVTYGEQHAVHKASRQRQGCETVLLVDDEARVLATEASVLESLGYTVMCAQSGDDAIGIFMNRADEIDLVILDLIMPEKNGIETLKEIRAIRADSAILINSGFSEENIRDGLSDYPYIHFISKPHTRQALGEKLASIFDREHADSISLLSNA